MQLPLTIRLAYYSFRAVIRAGLVFLCAWLLLIPATAAEIDKLRAAPDTAFPKGLREMRAAQVFVAIAPSQAYAAVGSVVAPNVPVFAIRLGLMNIAAGNFIPPQAAPQEEPFSARDIEGPRFIRVD